MTTLQCQQAVFTSIRSPTGGGYRLVAASSGLRVEEKKYITPRCPSHQGLCSDAPGAVGVCGYPLPTDRYCITYTCTAGPEYSGRGGNRVHTHILVLDLADADRFGYNPFELVRNYLRQESAQPLEKPPASLPELELPLQPLSDTAPLVESVSRVGPGWIAAALDNIFEQKAAVLLGPYDPLLLAEAVLLSLPAPLRCRTSFSAGLRYSLARGFNLAVVTDQTASQLRSVITGHAVALLTSAKGQDAPPQPQSDWTRLVESRWQNQAPDDLLTLTDGRFPDTSPQALNHYARFVLRRDQLRQVDDDGILNLLAEHFDQPAKDELAVTLAGAVTKEALERLAPSLTTTLDAIKAHWTELTDLWTKAEPHAGLLAQLMATCLKQAAQHDPLAAADLAAALVRAVGNQPAFALVQPALANLLEKLTEFVTGASARQLDDLAGHLAALEKVPALQGRITDLQASIRTRGPSKNPITS